jgi:hypothetical protein
VSVGVDDILVGEDAVGDDQFSDEVRGGSGGSGYVDSAILSQQVAKNWVHAGKDP